MGWWQCPRLQIFFHVENETERQNRNTQNTYVMSQDGIKKFGVNDHSQQVYFYSPPVMMCVF